MQIKYQDITKEVSFNVTNLKYNTPLIITFKDKLFNISTRNYYGKTGYAWKCQFYRRDKVLPVD